ncbi:MAG: trehalose-phosphatase [Anaerolineae bacterium]|nr:trehalose-phosphatase [Anaerolineae bacterium]
MTPRPAHELLDHVQPGSRVRLFLDYDGTLADFAPTPDEVYPDEALAELLREIAHHPDIHLSVVSGRRLRHVQRLVPVRGILLAGTYGIEILTPERDLVHRLEPDDVRPALDQVKPAWSDLLGSRDGFYLEDKEWALAIHARFADDAEAHQVLDEARQAADEIAAQHAPGVFRLLGGHKFLEIGPLLAHKGRTVTYLLSRFPWPADHLIFVGDDDKDEEAFEVIQEHGGVAIVVAPDDRRTRADYRLPSPAATRDWLRALLARLQPTP